MDETGSFYHAQPYAQGKVCGRKIQKIVSLLLLLHTQYALTN